MNDQLIDNLYVCYYSSTSWKAICQSDCLSAVIFIVYITATSALIEMKLAQTEYCAQSFETTELFLQVYTCDCSSTWVHKRHRSKINSH